MNSQQIKDGKISNNNQGFPLQLHLTGNPSNISSPSGNVPPSPGHLSLQIPGSSGSPMQLSNANVPVQLPSGGTISVPLHLSQASVPLLSSHVSQQNLHGQVIQFHTSGVHNSSRTVTTQVTPNSEKTSEQILGANLQGNVAIQLQEHNNSAQMKMQAANGPVTQSALQLQLQNSGPPVHLQVPTSNNNIQIRGNTRPLPHVVYIQTPSGLKPVTSAEIANTSSSGSSPQIIVRRPVTTGNAIQIISSVNVTPKYTTAPKALPKPSILNPNMPTQSIVIQKPKTNPPNVSPVSIAVSGGKHTFATYLSAVKKPSSVSKAQENQSILVSSNTTPTTPSQKLFLTPMHVPKIQQSGKYIYPASIAAKGPVINFQIANGQLQSDPQGNVTVMQDSAQFTGSSTEIPPLQPLSKSVTTPSTVSLPNATVQTQNSITDSCFSTSISAADNTFTTSIPGSRAELIGEQEYALSIPETNSSLTDDLYTVSIADDSDSLPEKSYTISIPEKGKSLLSKNASVEAVLQEVENINLSSAPVPTILRRSNSDSVEKRIVLNEKRRISLCTEDKKCNDDIENKIEKAKNKLFSQNLTILNKPMLEKVEETKLPSLFCDEKLEQELENKTNIKDNSVICETTNKNNGYSNVQRNPQINKDRRKSRLSADTYSKNNSLDKIGNDKIPFQFSTQSKDLSKIEIHTEEDSLGLQWQNDIALLNGSCLQIRTNEFGLIDIIDAKDNAISLTKYHAPLKQRINRDKKPSSPEDLYCCDGCGCHGMAAEFITPNFCSHTCQRNHSKNQEKKDKDSFDFKKKRRQKKTLIQKIKIKDLNNSVSESNVTIDEAKLLESLSADVTIQLSTPAIITDVSNNVETSFKKPLWICDKVGFSWMKYLDYFKAKAAPVNLFKESLSMKNCFKIGMKVEAIDPVHPSLFAVVTITEVQGYRLKLHFDGYHEDYDFWVNADSCDIFPPGWCEKNGRVLRPPMGFTPSSFSWPLYLKQVRAIAAPKHLFAHVSTTFQKICPNGFRIGLKLEAEDRKNSLTCVATVADVMESRVLIHFDSWDDIYDYWVDPTSPYIHPVGWCDEHGYSLTPPNTYKDPDHFTWDEYLKETNSTAVPPRAFRPRPPHNFKVGMKLEAVDKRVPFLIRVATISDTRFHQIRISFDGWPDDLSFWVDDDSPDIHPMDWCLRTSHPLEPPLTPEELTVPGQCGTGGCQGLGNSMGAKRTTHSLAAECPYRLPPSSPVLRDRLAGALPPPLHSEPRPRSIQVLPQRGRPPNFNKPDYQSGSSSEAVKPERITNRGRPLKFKKEDEIKTEIMESDEETNSNQSKKRRRGSSPVTQEKVERSVFEPGYLPNPSWTAPPAWSQHCVPLEDILQSQALRADPRNWSQTDVQDFVEKVSKSRDILLGFCKGRIDGESLLMLSQEDLVNILGMKLGPAIKLYGSIIQLRKKITA